MSKMVGIAEFKAKCERLLIQMEQDGEPIQLTRRGKVVGVISPPTAAPAATPLPSAFGMLKSDAYRFDLEPEESALERDWEAQWEAKWTERGFPGPSRQR